MKKIIIILFAFVANLSVVCAQPASDLQRDYIWRLGNGGYYTGPFDEFSGSIQIDFHHAPHPAGRR